MIIKKVIKYLSILIFFAGMTMCLPVNAIKIGLIDSTNSNYVASSTQGSILEGSSQRALMMMNPMQKYVLTKYGSKISISFAGHKYDLGTNYIIVKSQGGGFVSTKNKWYRGDLIVVNTGSGLEFINNVGLEDYLMGVVPSEMPRSWNYEAHKAQAIAARSYAVANLGKRGSKGYDLKDTPEDQAYGGASAESVRTNYAVMETKGQVMAYNNKVIPAYYHASAGGHTLDASSVWGKQLPFIKAVPSFDSNVKKNGHGIGMSQYGANNLANYGYNAYQILNYFYNGVTFNTLN